MAPWEIWVRATPMSLFVTEHSYLWPMLEILHYIGLCVLLGTVGVFDLRVLGVAKSIPPASLHRLIPWGIAAFVLNLLTGVLFFSGFPDQYAYNQAFHFKLLFLTAAAINVAVFYSAAFSEVRALGAGADAPMRAKVITAISLTAWISVLVCGRLLTFYRPPFMH